MNRTQIEISKIVIHDRQRDLNTAHVASLAESMAALGLIQPVVINQECRLIAGGHRLAAATKLGWTLIDVVYRETMSEDELQELELTENVKRADLHWTERLIAIAKIHSLKKKSSALASKTWGQRETGELLGVDQSSVSYSLIIARVLMDKPKDHEIWQCGSASEAWSLIMRWQQEEIQANLATRHVSVAPTPSGVTNAIDDPFAAFDGTIDISGGAEYDPITGQRIGSVARPASEFLDEMFDKVVIDISSHYVKGDSIAFMHSRPESFDHIITDIPYGIDIEMIDQHVGMKDINVIKEEHTVEGNQELFKQFFPAAFKCLKPNAYLITWCDFWEARGMADIAIEAGFKVQRWPITWSKTYPCLNQCAQYNFTKSTEIALVCRKGVITLPEKQSNCVIECGRDELCDLINHPFSKPFECWRRLITAISIENQSILDPFAGRGSSLLSGIQLGRNMFGCEINEQHYNAGLENLKQFYLKINPRSIFK